MIAKVINFFEMDGAGWSETWYTKDATDLREAKVRAQNVASFRSLLLAQGAKMVATRVSNVDIPGAASLDKSVAGNDQGAAGALQHDIWTTACRVHMFTAGGYHSRQCWVRGLPDTYLAFRDTTDREIWPQELTDPLQAWFDAMRNNLYAIKCKVKDNPPGTNPPRSVTALATEDGSGGTMVTATGITVNHGVDSVKISGCKFYGGEVWPINRTWKSITAVPPLVLGANEFIIPMQGKPGVGAAALFNYISGSGFAQLVKIDYLLVEDFFYDFFTSRKTGNPFFHRAGRLKKVTNR